MPWFIVHARTREMAAGTAQGGVLYTRERPQALAFESMGRARKWADTHAGPGDHLALSRDPEPGDLGANHRGKPGHYRARTYR